MDKLHFECELQSESKSNWMEPNCLCLLLCRQLAECPRHVFMLLTFVTVVILLLWSFFQQWVYAPSTLFLANRKFGERGRERESERERIKVLMSNDVNLFMLQKPLIINEWTLYLHFDQIYFAFLRPYNRHPICAHNFLANEGEFILRCSIKKMYRVCACEEANERARVRKRERKRKWEEKKFVYCPNTE